MLPDADPKATYGCPGVQRLFCPAGLPLTVARTARAQITLCAATGSAVMEVVDRTPLTSSIVSATTPAIYGDWPPSRSLLQARVPRFQREPNGDDNYE